MLKLALNSHKHSPNRKHNSFILVLVDEIIKYLFIFMFISFLLTFNALREFLPPSQ